MFMKMQINHKIEWKNILIYSYSYNEKEALFYLYIYILY